MRTYDTGANTHGTRPALRSLIDTIKRWLDRERELISLRNAVGMMSEARRADAAEYQDMVAAVRMFSVDSKRLKWLTADHADPETRMRVRSVLESMPTRSYSGACLDIDANMRPGEG